LRHKIKIQEIEEVKIKIQEKIQKLEEQLDLPILIELVKKIDTDNLLTEEEIVKIYQGMDKWDYSDVKGGEKWLDVEYLTKKSCALKHTFPPVMGFMLHKVTKTGSEDRYPPTNYYRLELKNKDGLTFYG
jgi:hypothetical protein